MKRLKDQGATSLSRLDESTSDLIDPKKDPVKRGKIQRMAELDPDPFWTEQSKETESR
jgi:hypothetical protein